MSNFQFLHKEWPAIYREANEAEKLTLTSPKASAMIARSALEKTVQWLYQNDEELEMPYDTKLSSLLHEQCFREIIKPSMFREVNLIRLNGNAAAHGKVITHDQSIASIKNLFRFFEKDFLATRKPHAKRLPLLTLMRQSRPMFPVFP